MSFLRDQIMPLTQKKLRVVLRWVHIIVGLILLCYIYSPFGEALLFQWIVKIFLIPLLVVSGVGLWKSTILNKWLRIK